MSNHGESKFEKEAIPSMKGKGKEKRYLSEITQSHSTHSTFLYSQGNFPSALRYSDREIVISAFQYSDESIAEKYSPKSDGRIHKTHHGVYIVDSQYNGRSKTCWLPGFLYIIMLGQLVLS